MSGAATVLRTTIATPDPDPRYDQGSKAMNKLPDISFIRECLDYDPDTGIFLWRKRPRSHFVSDRGRHQWNIKLAGKPAGSRLNGAYGKVYWCIRVVGHIWLAHRLAWLVMHDVDPWPDEIDHIDGDPLNNRITNLRPATRSQQSANSRRQSGGTITGVKGVTISSGRKILRYDARVTVNGVTHYLGCFPTIEKAAEVCRVERIKLHGEFHHHG
jgi:hypothetical protein